MNEQALPPGLTLDLPTDLLCEDSPRAPVDTCRITIDVTVRNGTREPLVLRRIAAETAPGKVALDWTLDPVVVGPGRSHTFHAANFREGKYVLRVTCTNAQNESVFAEGHTTIHDERVSAAKEKCKACNGKWGPMGILGVPACDCQTNDAGKVCYDRSECEGDCVGGQREDVDATHYRMVGKCSPSTSPFGCRVRVRAGVKLKSAPPESAVCVD